MNNTNKNINKLKLTSIALVVATTITGCSQTGYTSHSETAMSAKHQVGVKKLTTDDAAAFLSRVEKESHELTIESSRAEWIYQNFITEDTSALSAAANQKFTEAGVAFAMEAAKFDSAEVTADQRRKLNILKQSLVIPAPQDPAKSSELSKIGADLGAMYGKGTYTTKAGEKLSLGDMTLKMATSQDYDELLELWQGWRTISPEMKPLYTRKVELAN